MSDGQTDVHENTAHAADLSFLVTHQAHRPTHCMCVSHWHGQTDMHENTAQAADLSFPQTDVHAQLMQLISCCPVIGTVRLISDMHENMADAADLSF